MDGKFQINQMFVNRYFIKDKLGAGGMGDVYKAVDTYSGTEVAIKRAKITNAVHKKRFIREYAFLNAVAHPNIVKAYECIEKDKELFIVMEHITGWSLKEFIEDDDYKLSLPDQLAVANQAARGVELLNAGGIIHRDIKPANIMVNVTKGNVKVLDLGVGKSLQQESMALTKEGFIVGTPAYMSPEQFNGEVNIKTDVFALGVTFYQFFLRQKNSPFAAENLPMVVRKIQNHSPPDLYEEIIKNQTPLTYLQQEAYASISKLLTKTMEKESSKRLSVGEMADGLAKVWDKLLEQEDTHHGRNTHMLETSVVIDNKLLKILEEINAKGHKLEFTKAKNDKKIINMPGKQLRRYSRSNKENSYKTTSLILPGIVIIFLSFFFIFQEDKKNKDNKTKLVQQTKLDCPASWPVKLWKICWQQEQELADFTIENWVHLPTVDQIKYAKSYQQWYAKKKQLAVKKKFIVNNAQFSMVFIPPGRFWMGVQKNEEGRFESDQNRHKVTISKPFWVGETEVTQAQWKTIMGEKNNPSYFLGDNRPVEQVTWYLCKEFCDKTQFSLLSESQWEYSCRAATTSRFYWGEWDKKKINSLSYWVDRDIFDKNSITLQMEKKIKSGVFHIETCKVGNFSANAFGLYDMLGNVYEWCEDIYKNRDTDVNDFLKADNALLRVRRGGHFGDKLNHCRSAARDFCLPNKFFSSIGFRISKPINK